MLNVNDYANCVFNKQVNVTLTGGKFWKFVTFSNDQHERIQSEVTEVVIGQNSLQQGDLGHLVTNPGRNTSLNYQLLFFLI